jgi:condensin complex subunit 3
VLKYFNPVTDPKINQILGIFFEAMIKKKKQEYMQKALINTLFIILEAPSDSPLQEIKPEIVLKFVIDSTRPQYCSPGLNLHSMIAMSFLQVMLDNLEYKIILRILSKELMTLEISDDPVLRHDLIQCTESLIANETLDPKIIKNVKMFKEMLEGKEIPINQDTGNNSDREGDGDTVNQEPSHEEHENEPQENELYPNERPVFNKSSILGTPPHSSTMNPPEQFHRSASNVRSLRRSLNISKPPLSDSKIFKVPQADATRALLKKTTVTNLQARMDNESSSSAEEEAETEDWSVQATQETAPNDESVQNESLEVPLTQHVELPMTQSEPMPDNDDSEQETVADKENDQTSDDEVIEASPNVTGAKVSMKIA